MLFDAITFGVRIFLIQFLLEFRRKIIDFGVLFDAISSANPSPKFGLGDAITSGVTIFRASISARISTKNHQFWRAS